MTFKKTKFSQINNKRNLSASKTLLSQSDTYPLPKGRKSIVDSYSSLQGGVNPTSSALNVLPFLPLICCLLEFRKYAIQYKRGLDGGVAKLKNESFVLLCYIALFSGNGLGTRKASRGVSVTKLCLLYYNSSSSTNIRNVQYTLDALLSFGLVSRYAIKNGNKYVLSVAAEKIFSNAVSVEDIRLLRDMVKSLL